MGSVSWVVMDTMPGLFAKVRLQDGGKVYLVVSEDPAQHIPNVPIDVIYEVLEGPANLF